MIRDEARVLSRAALAGLLLPPAIGAILVAIFGAFTDPVRADAYLSIGFVMIAFGMAALFAGPLGLIGGVTVAALAMWWGRRGKDLWFIRRGLVIVGALVGASLGWACSQWVFTLARGIVPIEI